MHVKAIHTTVYTLAALFIILLLTGCSSKETATADLEGNRTDIPTQWITEAPTTVLSPTMPIPTLPMPGASATPTDLPLIILAQPTAIPSSQPETDMNGRKILPATVQIVAPGPGSKVASPIHLQMKLYPGDGEKLLMQLFGEDGRLMAERLMSIDVPKSGWANQSMEIPFEVSTAGEAALLVVSTRDEFGRRVAQTSVQLLLLQIGDSDIEPSGFDRQPFVLDTPVYLSLAKNGLVHVQGFVHAIGGGPIAADLVTQSGGIIDSEVITLPEHSDDQDFVPFTMDIPYSVSMRTPVRLILRQMDEGHSSIDVSLWSVAIYLDP